MRNITVFCICFVMAVVAVFAQEKMYIYKTDNSVLDMNISEIDSLAFRNDNLNLYIYKTDDAYSDILISEIDSLTFETDIYIYIYISASYMII